MIISKDIIEASRYFIKLVELGSYSSVKKAYNVELNTIKSKIDNLEKFLDIRLVQNIQNRINPTEAGMKYYHSCRKIYKDLEATISSVKQSGFREKQTIKVLGSPLFIKIMIDRVLPRIKQVNDDAFNFALDSYSVENLDGSQYQFDTYNVIQIYAKHLEYLDLDDWIVCSSIDNIKLQANMYGNKDLIKSMHNNPEKIKEANLVLNRYEYNRNVVNFRHLDEEYKLNPDKIKYVVDNVIQKANLLRKEKVIGFMPKFYYDSVLKDSVDIDKIKGVEVDFPFESILVLVYKHSTHTEDLVKTIRSGLRKLNERNIKIN